MTKLPVILCLLFVVSCTDTDPTLKSKDNGSSVSSTSALQNDEYIYWVNSLKAECVGVARMQCLQIQKGDELNPADWKLFYAGIKGFNYEQGYIYKIIVKEEPIPSSQIPADHSSILYTLVQVLDKQIDDKLRLHDIWALESINSKQINLADRQKRPQLELNLNKMMMSGHDGCNNFTGAIENINSEKLKFSNIAVTRKACFDMDIPNRFHQHINNVQAYSINDLKLYLFDNQGNELFGFKKID